MLKQKAKGKHLNLGGCNSKYFHALFKSNKKASITSIQDHRGNVHTDPNHIKPVFIEFFEGILAPNCINHSRADLSHVKTTGKLSAEDAALLC